MLEVDVYPVDRALLGDTAMLVREVDRFRRLGVVPYIGGERRPPVILEQQKLFFLLFEQEGDLSI